MVNIIITLYLINIKLIKIIILIKYIYYLNKITKKKKKSFNKGKL